MDLKDSRFAHVGKDPRFRRVPKSQRKVKVDERFGGMFKDDRFKLKYSVDKRGRPVRLSSNDQLKRYYDIDDESGSDNEESSPPPVSEKALKEKKKAPVIVNGFTVTEIGALTEEADDGDDESSGPEGSDTEVPADVKSKLLDLSVDYARGEGALFSDSSSDESDGEAVSEDEELVHNWGELDKDAERTDKPSRRIAVCNMDWDRIRAVDLFVLLHSFSPQGGCVQKVTIYPSDFGLERMKEEEVRGPKELVESTNPEVSESNEDDGEAYHLEKLRQYQLNRLKYYYAVVECDCEGTASKIYDECDGQEFESSAAKLDLRFIPDEMDFDQKARDVCEAMPDVSQYEPRIFMNSALQQAQVHLTWDETNPDRQAAIQKLFPGKKGHVANITDSDVKGLLATSSEDEDEPHVLDIGEQVVAASDSGDESDSDRIAKYKNLLAELTCKEEKSKKKDDVEMEITWGVGLKEKAESLVRKKQAERSAETTWEQQLAKRREKRKEAKLLKKQQKKQEQQNTAEQDDDDDIPSDVDMNDPYFREEFEGKDFQKPKKVRPAPFEKTANDPAGLELLLMDEQDGQRQHFNMQAIVKQHTTKSKKKNKKDQDEQPEDHFKVQVEDPRFSALYTSHHFNLDPSDPNFKRTPAMEAIIEEKSKRRIAQGGQERLEPEPKVRKQDAELSRLVRSVKGKVGQSAK